MPRESYQQSLADLREDVLFMSEVVSERLRTGLDALEAKDEALAHEVIEGDEEINEMYLDLEGECIDLLALQQPVAGDLRLVAASFKILTDLERVADLATNLGAYTLDAHYDRFPDVDVQAIGQAVAEMLEDAMDAYARDDVEACFAVAERDDEVDAMCERATDAVVRELIETELEGDQSDADIERLMQDVSRLLLTVRDLERVGDHAVNVAARTLYMVENDPSLLE
ncbi:phosphate signaling complex protein PhoU [Salinirubellus salinus]|uniref:Phosphate-specific transport system accessory protein PhoU n=1 Tax=Salinirubellus salinus TaxID=1364945 RepID=A0A9E7U373_9EURY|nr:phosphate signaling complex protein PhoU [Salinirubellus salinus]UWM52935.1 phosphate signaling complex protein PhoU [Salinirubellus salinus]